jgi:hypothetical protein
MAEYAGQRESLMHRIYGINDIAFEAVALELWGFQYEWNPLYRNFCDSLGASRWNIHSLADIPFLPVTMFRDHIVKTGDWGPVKVFHSSGTTGSHPGQHFIRDLSWYHKMAERCFSTYYGDPGSYTWLALLPSYIERPDSSLVDMVDYFMGKSNPTENGFIILEDQLFLERIQRLAKNRTPTVLIGVSFALLDLFEFHRIPVWENLLVIETGGMKGRRQEITREELYAKIRKNHPTLRVASEYGMTELLSQAYSQNHLFKGGPTLKVLVRDISDPLQIIEPGQRGAINVIDLANMDTCAFVATEDVGVAYEDGSFSVLGRLDQSDIRGCNLMYS